MFIQPAFGPAWSPGGARPGVGAGLVLSSGRGGVSPGWADTGRGPSSPVPIRPQLRRVCPSAEPWHGPPERHTLRECVWWQIRKCWARPERQPALQGWQRKPAPARGWPGAVAPHPSAPLSCLHLGCSRRCPGRPGLQAPAPGPSPLGAECQGGGDLVWPSARGRPWSGAGVPQISAERHRPGGAGGDWPGHGARWRHSRPFLPPWPTLMYHQHTNSGGKGRESGAPLPTCLPSGVL